MSLSKEPPASRTRGQARASRYLAKDVPPIPSRIAIMTPSPNPDPTPLILLIRLVEMGEPRHSILLKSKEAVGWRGVEAIQLR